MVRKSCGVVLSLSAWRSEHYGKEHDAEGDFFKHPVQSFLFSQAISWQAIPLFFSLEERRQANQAGNFFKLSLCSIVHRERIIQKSMDVK